MGNGDFWNHRRWRQSQGKRRLQPAEKGKGGTLNSSFSPSSSLMDGTKLKKRNITDLVERKEKVAKKVWPYLPSYAASHIFEGKKLSNFFREPFCENGVRRNTPLFSGITAASAIDRLFWATASAAGGGRREDNK